MAELDRDLDEAAGRGELAGAVSTIPTRAPARRPERQPRWRSPRCLLVHRSRSGGHVRESPYRTLQSGARERVVVPRQPILPRDTAHPEARASVGAYPEVCWRAAGARSPLGPSGEALASVAPSLASVWGLDRATAIMRRRPVARAFHASDGGLFGRTVAAREQKGAPHEDRRTIRADAAALGSSTSSSTSASTATPAAGRSRSWTSAGGAATCLPCTSTVATTRPSMCSRAS